MPAGAQWLTAVQVAALIQRSTRTLKRWRSKGGGPPFVRFDDGEVRYSRNKLDEWMRSFEGSEPADFAAYQPSVVRSSRR